MSKTLCILIPVNCLHIILELLVIYDSKKECKLRILGCLKQLLCITYSLLNIPVWAVLIVVQLYQKVTCLYASKLKSLLCGSHGALIILKVVAVYSLVIILHILSVGTVVTGQRRIYKRK